MSFMNIDFADLGKVRIELFARRAEERRERRRPGPQRFL